MKYHIFVAVILTISVGVLASKPTFGLQAGFNLSRLSELDGYEVHMAGSDLGCLVQLPVSKKILLQPELLYIEKGEFWATPLGVLGGWERLSYWELPLLVKYNLPVGKITLQPELGPSLGVLLAARKRLASIYSDETATIDIRDSLNWVDIGVNAGLDVVLGRHFLLGIRYNNGLINVNKNKDADKDYNRSYMFYIGYLFGKRINKED